MSGTQDRVGAPSATARAGGAEALVLPFAEIDRRHLAQVGGKGANLGEMTRAGLPVPPGFVVTVASYQRMLEESGMGERLTSEVAAALSGPPEHLTEVAAGLQRLILDAPIPGDVEQAVAAAYEELGASALVAVRSSATAEETARFSFAGMFESFLNVQGVDSLLEKVRAGWASAFGERVLSYRQRQGVLEDVHVGVVVQRMVQSSASGVLFTANPATGARDTLVIEAAPGLGEVVVGGLVTPDRYEIDQTSGRVRVRTLGFKHFLLRWDSTIGANVREDLDAAEARRECLSDADLAGLVELARRLEAHYGHPQDAEWAVEDGVVWLVQTRPITTLGPEPAAPPLPDTPHATRDLRVRGLGASPGRAAGPVRVMMDPGAGDRLDAGDVLVAPNTTPDWLPVLRRSSAVVTDVGGMTSHAAIVSRELGIPCVVGTRDATRVLSEGELVTVDGGTGEVLAGLDPSTRSARGDALRSTGHTESSGRPVTATRLYVNLAEPSRAEEVAGLPVDGVGLLRAEFMLLEALDGVHPALLLERGRDADLVSALVEGIGVIGRAFHPRPVLYRTMDFRSNEFRGLEGGERFEPQEANPMIGYRGCFRYAREPDLFGLELRALSAVREELPGVQLMLPFVRSVRDLAACQRLIAASELAHDPELELWVMAEVPSVLALLDRYVDMGVHGFSIGSNDLTQLMLGVDRDNERLAPAFDECDPAMLWAFETIIRRCRDRGVPCSICGQAPSVHPALVRRLVQWGIDSVSVSADAVHRTRHLLASAERRVLLEAARAIRER